MNNIGDRVVDIASKKAVRRTGRDEPLSNQERATVSAICNRVVRILGLLDREGLTQDIAIVQANCPLDLEALAAAPEKIFVDELLSIVDATDRRTASLKGNFRSRYMLDAAVCSQSGPAGL